MMALEVRIHALCNFSLIKDTATLLKTLQDLEFKVLERSDVYVKDNRLIHILSVLIVLCVFSQGFVLYILHSMLLYH